MRSGGTYLGTLCRRSHDHEGTGMSLRHASGHCAACTRENLAARMQVEEKRAREVQRARIRSARRRKGVVRPAMTPERKREIGRLSKQKARTIRAEQTRAYAREFYQRNSLRIRIRNRVYKAIRQQKLDKVLTVAGYGIDVAAIAERLGPCPGAHKDWHIDHIRPLSSFDLGDPAQVMQAFAPDNHQWLPAQENLLKGARYA